jgi:hypothetical protein
LRDVAIAALKRCATQKQVILQNQVMHRISNADSINGFRPGENVKKLTLSTLMMMLVMFGVSPSVCAQDDSGPLSSLKFLVVRDSDGKPVRNAEIVLHPTKGKGKQASGEMELKTDAEGKTSVDGIPYGRLQIQVLAPHFQTFGEDYDVNKAELQITVKLKHPGDQYSTYENHGDDKKPQ